MKAAYASQFGSSSAFTIGFHQIYQHLLGSHDQAALEQARDKYEACKLTQDAAARAIQWDLYNRLKSPDVAIFHKSGDGPGWWNTNILSGTSPAFSGVSQSQKYHPGGWFGNTVVLSPLAIRSVIMATTSADIYKGHSFKSEQEVSIGEPIRLDAAHTLVSTDPGLGLAGTWLSKITSHGADGSVVQQLKAYMAGEITDLPIPPEPANITTLGANGQQTWVPPPIEATKNIGALKYANVDANGAPQALPANTLDLKPGDYIEGMQGTRYIIIEDKGDPFGVRYYKVTDGGTQQPDGSFTGHQDWPTEESYSFEGQGVKPFKKLSGHADLPEQAEQAKTGFVEHAWSETAADAGKFVSNLDPGTKFVVSGIPYEIQTHMPGGQTKIENLDTGGLAQINGTYKTPWLVLKEGYTEEGVPAFKPEDYFVHEPAELKSLKLKQGDLVYGGVKGEQVWQVQAEGLVKGKLKVVGVTPGNQGKLHELEAAETVRKLEPKPIGWMPAAVGDTLAIDGKKGEVTKLLAHGVVQVNLKPGVVKLKPNDVRLAGLFRPGAYDKGEKMKLKDLGVGEKFHGGSGGNMRPYLVLEQDVPRGKGKPKGVRVRNLDTGETSVLPNTRKYARLNPKSTDAPEPGAPITAPVDHGKVFNPDAWKVGGWLPSTEFVVGTKFKSGAAYHEVVADKGSAWETKNLLDGSMGVVTKTPQEFESLEPSGSVPVTGFDPNAYVVGKPKKLSELKKGDIFQGTKKGKHYVVKTTGAKSGLSAMDLETGKVSSPWSYDKVAPVLEPKSVAGVDYADLKQGDPVKLSSLKAGDQFEHNGMALEVVEEFTSESDNITAAPVLEDGGLGFPNKVGNYPGLLVTYHQKAPPPAPPAAPPSSGKLDPFDTNFQIGDTIEDKGLLYTVTSAGDSALMVVPQGGGQSIYVNWPVTKVSGPAAPAGPIDTASLPLFTAEGFSPKSKTGGGYTFTKAKNAAPGVLLKDKAGQLYKIVEAGADPVVSNGDGHGKLAGELNLKVVDEPFDDHAGAGPEVAAPPGLIGGSPAGTLPALQAVAAAQTDWADNTVVKLQLDGLKPGDIWRTSPGAPTRVMLGAVPDNASQVYSQDLGTGVIETFDGNFVPDQVVPALLAQTPFFEDHFGGWNSAGQKSATSSSRETTTRPLSDVDAPAAQVLENKGGGVLVIRPVKSAHKRHVRPPCSSPSRLRQMLNVFEPVPKGDRARTRQHKVAASSIPIGSTFTTGALYGSPAGTYEVVGWKGVEAWEAGQGVKGAAVIKSKYNVPQALHVKEDVAWVKNVATGEYNWVGNDLPVTPGAAAAAPSGDPDDYEDVGKATLEDLKPGDFFKSVVGKVWQVGEPGESVSGTPIVSVTQLESGQITKASPTMPVIKAVPKHVVGVVLPAPGPEVAAPHEHVYSAGEQMFSVEGEPLIKGQTVWVALTGQAVVPIGSGNAPGTVQVKFLEGGVDGAESPFLPNELTLTPPDAGGAFQVGDTVTWETGDKPPIKSGKVFGFEEGHPSNVKIQVEGESTFYVVSASKLEKVRPYNPDDWEPAGTAPASALQPGEHFELKGKHYIVEEGPIPSYLPNSGDIGYGWVTNLEDGKPLSFKNSPGGVGDSEVTMLQPKGPKPMTMGELKVGDVFKMPGGGFGKTFTVTEPGTAVSSDGTLTKDLTGLAANNQVELVTGDGPEVAAPGSLAGNPDFLVPNENGVTIADLDIGDHFLSGDYVLADRVGQPLNEHGEGGQGGRARHGGGVPRRLRARRGAAGEVRPHYDLAARGIDDSSARRRRTRPRAERQRGQGQRTRGGRSLRGTPRLERHLGDHRQEGQEPDGEHRRLGRIVVCHGRGTEAGRGAVIQGDAQLEAAAGEPRAEHLLCQARRPESRRSCRVRPRPVGSR